MWWNVVIMYPHCRPHFLQRDHQQRCVPQYFSVICEALGCLAWLFPTRWGNVWPIVMWPCKNWSISVWVELSWNDIGHPNLQILLLCSVYCAVCCWGGCSTFLLCWLSYKEPYQCNSCNSSCHADCSVWKHGALYVSRCGGNNRIIILNKSSSQLPNYGLVNFHCCGFVIINS